jgi:hypothetical protein
MANTDLEDFFSYRLLKVLSQNSADAKRIMLSLPSALLIYSERYVRPDSLSMATVRGETASTLAYVTGVELAIENNGPDNGARMSKNAMR